MSRTTILALSLLLALPAAATASSGDQPEPRSTRDWRGLCVNCQPDGDAAASRLGAPARIATKLVAPNTCADPGPSAWFAEEEDHLAAFLNSTSATIQYK